jgi:hypothetical protein
MILPSSVSAAVQIPQLNKGYHIFQVWRNNTKSVAAVPPTNHISRSITPRLSSDLPQQTGRNIRAYFNSNIRCKYPQTLCNCNDNNRPNLRKYPFTRWQPLLAFVCVRSCLLLAGCCCVVAWLLGCLVACWLLRLFSICAVITYLGSSRTEI